MNEKKETSKSLKIAAVAIMFLLIGATAVQAVVKTTASMSEFYWEDDFLDPSKIDSSKSSNIEINDDDEVIMSNTNPAWRYPWPYMKELIITNTGSSQDSYVMPLTIYKEPEMKSDFSDIRFVNEYNGIVYECEYWIGETRPSSADVWVRIEPGVPSDETRVCMFYGDDNAPDHSNFGMIFKWDDRTSPDIMISYKAEAEGAWDADVGFGGGRFLVAWEERKGPEDLGGLERARYCCIHGRTYNSDGGNPNPSGNNDIDISPAQPPDLSYHAENPSVSSGGSKYFVAWEENPATIANRWKIDIKGAIVSTSGSVTPLSSPICDEEGIQADPCVAYGGGKYLVVWEDARLGIGNYDVWGRFYSTSGSPSGSAFQITSGSTYEGEPWVCYGGGFFVVVYEQGGDPLTGPFSLYAKKISSSGSTQWTTQIAAGTSSKDNVWPSVNYNEETNEYFVCWNDADLSSDQYRGNVWGNFLSPSGTLLFSNFVVQSSQYYIRTDCVPYLGDMFFVSYDKKDEVWGKLVYNNDGEVIMTSEQALSDGSSQNIDWNNIAVSDNGRIFPVWEDKRDQMSEYADAFGSVWHIYKSTASPLISHSFGSKQELITDAVLMSKIIDVSELNVQKWQDFYATYDMGDDDCNLQFYVCSSSGSKIHTGLSEDISNLQVNDIRLKAEFSRSKASSTPSVDKWGVSYKGGDTTDPRTEIELVGDMGNNNWYKGAVDVWLYGYDDASGVETINYKIDGGSTQTSYANPTRDIISQTGTHSFEYWSVDFAGNIEPHNHEYGIKIDNRFPTVIITKPEDEWNVDPGDVEIEFTVNEVGSGFDRAELYINHDPDPVKTWTSEQSKYTYILEDTSTAETYDVDVSAYDIAGNVGTDHIKIHIGGGSTRAFSPEMGYLYTANGVTGQHVLLLFFSLSLVFTDKLTVKLKPESDLGVTKVTFEIKGRAYKEGTDYDPDSGGFFEYQFDPPTGLYTITAHMFDGSYEVETFNWPGEVIFINAL